MRIGIDARALSGPYTGDRTYWLNLIRALIEVDTARANEYLLFSRTLLPEQDIPCAPNIKTIVVPAANDRLWTLHSICGALRRERANLLHVQYTSPPRALCPCPIITTVHDISFRLHPEWFTCRDRALMNLTVPVSMRGARFVITDSESSRSDIQRVYALSTDKLHAIPLGISPSFQLDPHKGREELRTEARNELRQKYQIDQPFILALGVLQPRKNLEMLASAYGKLKARAGLPHLLVLVGKAGWRTAREEIVRAAGGAGCSVLFPGYVPDDELPAWYRACDVFAHPSLYEGFGIPPLEAMASGAPVVVSDAPALPEVVGDAGLIMAANDADAWAGALEKVLTNKTLWERLSSAGPLRAGHFSWKTTAERTLELYRAAVSGG